MAKPKLSHDKAVDETETYSAWKFFVAIGILLVILVGYILYTQYQAKKMIEENKYNGFDFSQAQGGIWVTRIQARNQPYDIPFYFHPRDTEEVYVEVNATLPLILYPGPAKVTISVDPAASSKIVIAAIEISRILGTKYNLYNYDVSSALSAPAQGSADIPVVTCANATKDDVVVQFVQGQQNAIARSKNPYCVILQYTDVDESVRVADRMAYMLLRIM